jgi:phage tail sheath protein FI
MVPPVGHLAGVYALVTREMGVQKAPANEELAGAVDVSEQITQEHVAELAARGINTIRDFRLEGGAIRVWGARTLSQDPEWKYVNVRRLFIFLEHSIDHGLQFAAFEPNGEELWSRVRALVNDFLFNQWKNGLLQGAKPEEAFFVRCDRSTMTQEDIDNGRLVCTIGVAAVRPAEFVIFRIGTKTADENP